MIQKRIPPKNESQRSGKKSVPPLNAVWKQDESLPCFYPGQISPLTTAAVVKDFLLRQGMDNESWRFTNVKDLHLPSVHTNGSRHSSACLRAVSVPLTSRKDRRRVSSVCESETNPKGTLDWVEVGPKDVNIILSKVDDREENARLVSTGAGSKNLLKVYGKEFGIEQSLGRKNELFILPSRFKYYTPVNKNNNSNNSKRNCIDKGSRPVTPKLVLIRDSAEATRGASVSKIFDFIDETYFFQRSKTNLNVQSEDTSKESRGIKGSQESGGNSIKPSVVNNLGTSSGRIEGSTTDKLMATRQQKNSENVCLHFRKENKTAERGGAVGIKQTQMSDFEQQVERFNEISPLISGFNRRYPRVHLSLRYLVNHLNHKRMVNKFYGIVDSRRLNANFTPDNVLQSNGDESKKYQRLQSKRIRWLAAATDALELETSKVIARYEKQD